MPVTGCRVSLSGTVFICLLKKAAGQSMIIKYS